LKESQLGAIVARSFGRIYYRNCINNALPAITCPDAVDEIRQGEVIEIDLNKGELFCQAGVFQFPVLPEAVMGIFQAGGLIPYTKNILSAKHNKGA
jgi:3-isopropylmalate/(R)-2-methylmalate dehydratase small subunit